MSHADKDTRTQDDAATALALAPGSASAIASGCNCPIYDNARGKGWLCSGLYIMRDDCPIHGTPAPAPNVKDEPRRLHE